MMQTCFGFGFVPCWQAEDAVAFTRVFPGFQFEHVQSGKRLSIELGQRSSSSTDSSSSLMTFDADMRVRAVAPVSSDNTEGQRSDFVFYYASESGSYGAERGTESTAFDGMRPHSFVGSSSGVPDACELPSTHLTTVD
eukprot:TRINITY_DN10010_c2_g1_i1.p3 TRINITY_DN10010_c2_g1~~TRINITY_DN10010_c2_g1_i1.p3  ORF type:complete len:138 (-),score=19.49 TRINITY_DN10010_c2_g1_i1:204-617(-)